MHYINIYTFTYLRYTMSARTVRFSFLLLMLLLISETRNVDNHIKYLYKPVAISLFQIGSSDYVVSQHIFRVFNFKCSEKLTAGTFHKITNGFSRTAENFRKFVIVVVDFVEKPFCRLAIIYHYALCYTFNRHDCV